MTPTRWFGFFCAVFGGLLASAIHKMSAVLVMASLLWVIGCLVIVFADRLDHSTRYKHKASKTRSGE